MTFRKSLHEHVLASQKSACLIAPSYRLSLNQERRCLCSRCIRQNTPKKKCPSFLCDDNINPASLAWIPRAKNRRGTMRPWKLGIHKNKILCFLGLSASWRTLRWPAPSCRLSGVTSGFRSPLIVIAGKDLCRIIVPSPVEEKVLMAVPNRTLRDASF